jgi:hypothetical protein
MQQPLAYIFQTLKELTWNIRKWPTLNAGSRSSVATTSNAAKSGIVSRDLGIFWNSLGFFFILKSQSRNFLEIIEKGKFEV